MKTELLDERERGAVDGLYASRFATRTCDDCLKSLPMNHYSMSPSNLRDPRVHPSCNECMTARKTKYQRLLYFAADISDWMHEAKCVGEDPGMFHPLGLDDRFKKVCEGCPVMAQCALRGTETDSDGVWGGQLWVKPLGGLYAGVRVTAEEAGLRPRGRPRKKMKIEGDSSPGPAPKMTEAQDRELLYLSTRPGWTLVRLAEKYGVSVGSIRRAKARAESYA